MNRKNVTVILPKGENEDYYKFKFIELMRFIVANHKDAVKFEQKSESMKLIIKNSFESPEKLLEFLIDFSKSVRSLFDSNFAKDKSVN